MPSPFASMIDRIRKQGFHNHRLDAHVHALRETIVNDLAMRSHRFETDLAKEVIGCWQSVRSPELQNRKLDLVIAEVDRHGYPNIKKLRICVKSKSVITAHRSANSRLADLYATPQVLQALRSEAVLVATVMVGVAERVLNVPDKLKPVYKNKPDQFETQVVPRLSSGDQSLWDEFEWAISTNKPEDPRITIEKFRELPTRPPGRTHIVGYDYVLLIPAFIDNVNPPFLPPPGDPKSFGINLNRDYAEMIEVICKAYRARWHL